MTGIQVRYSSVCDQAVPLIADLSTTLAALGVQLMPVDEGDPLAPELLLFDTPTEQLYERLAAHTARVLAVALYPGGTRAFATWRLLAAGASDVLLWTDTAELAAMIVGRLQRWATIDSLVDSPLVRDNLVGRSHAWLTVLRQVVEVAYFTQSPVLIIGESGTGKELVARLIHTLDTRSDKGDLIVLDCSTVVPELSGSEFFGHERGAFTNAWGARDGAFALADKGSLFLDEVGELPPSLQAELLRVVQERTYKRVGSNTWRRTDFRLICATNRDLVQEEGQGRFRRDFYHRIAAFICRLPPLRERQADILPLARHFWKQLRPDEPVPEFDPAVCDYLRTRPYAGNVRELRQLIQRMSCRYVGSGPVTPGLIVEDDRPQADVTSMSWCDEAFERAIRQALAMGLGLKEIGRAAEETAERIALEDEEGSLQRAAQRLGVTDRALQMRRANRRRSTDRVGLGRS